MMSIKFNKTNINDKALLFFILFSFSAVAQTVTFTTFPRDVQLFVRNKSTNLATVPIAGIINSSTGYTSLALEVYKNNQLQNTLPFNLTYVSGIANFNFSIPINAELSKYTFRLLSNNNIILKEASNITAGDVYIVSGQSNAVYQNPIQTTSPFIISYHNNGFLNINQNFGIGSIAYHFAEQIVSEKQVPVLVLNGGQEGQPIHVFLRNDSDKFNTSTNYGSLLTRYIDAGFVTSDVTAIIWYQGESNGENPKSYYLSWFNDLYNDWKEDYNPGHFYVFQVHSVTCGITSVSLIPEAHRQLPSLYSDVQVISTNGALQGMGGCHYENTNGYNVLAERLYNLINHDVYGSSNTMGIYSPNITNCYSFPNQPKLTFELTPANDFYSFESGVHSDFFFENSAISILGGSVTGNKVTLFLSEPITTNTILLSYLGRVTASVPYIKNQKGIGLLNFKNIPVAQSIYSSISLTNSNNSNYFVNTLQGNYSYADANDDPEGISTYQWYVADDASGTNQTAIVGATASTFTITPLQNNKYIGLGVTPKALTGSITGTEVIYYNPSPVIGAASFTFTSAAQTSKNFYVNRVMNASDAIAVSINVTAPGAVSFSTTTVNGYSFSGSGTYAAGAHTVTLTAAGTQTAYNAAGDAFTITGIGASTETTSLTVSNIKLGADFTAHYNGITSEVSVDNTLATYTTGETFNNNGTCVSKPISASTCMGSTITVGSNTYNIANINGQCWMTQNLKELPNGVAVNATQWLNTSSGDLGYYGYYNMGIPNGSAGWATTVPAANEGLLYQWSAAMLGNATERAKGVCPTGWHIPSDCEWMYLEHGQGMSLSQQVTNEAWRANSNSNQGNPGYKLRSAGANQTNASGFSALLPGIRHNIGSFVNRSSNGAWWTSSQVSTSTAYNRDVNTGTRGVARSSNYNKGFAFNIRCLKD